MSCAHGEGGGADVTLSWVGAAHRSRHTRGGDLAAAAAQKHRKIRGEKKEGKKDRSIEGKKLIPATGFDPVTSEL